MALADLSISNYTKVTIDSTPIGLIENIDGLTAESNIVSVNHYNQKYSRNLVGSASCGPVTLTLSYAPDEAGQIALDAAIEDGEAVAFKVEFMTSQGGSAETTISFSGLVASKSISNAYDSQRTVDYTIAVDGGFTES